MIMSQVVNQLWDGNLISRMVPLDDDIFKMATGRGTFAKSRFSNHFLKLQPIS